MKQIAAGIVLLALAAPALADPQRDKNAADSASAVIWAEWVDICTTGNGWKFSEAERLKICVVQESILRSHGNCMYSPGVIGIWDGKHCR